MCKKKLSKHYLAVKRCLLDVNYENFTDTANENLEIYNRVIDRIREYLNDNV